MINRVEDNQVAGDIERPDPEVQAGRALRRLRLAKGWSQEEVARRMQAYGYDFHQTMIAKIEAAQRPLRVRELADFAALYGADILQLIYPSSDSLEEVTQELREAERRQVMSRQQARVSADRVAKLRDELIAAEADFDSARRELAMLDERVEFLRQETKKFTGLNPAKASTAAEFVEMLLLFKAQAGEPDYTDIAMRAGSTMDRSAMAQVFGSRTLPPLDAVGVIIMGCGGTAKDLAAFKAAWQRIRKAEEWESIRSAQN
jgi:transcriptional regulator with XRE-family HTH domain